MARHLVRLKIALLRASTRATGAGRVVGLVIVLVLSLGFGGVGGLLMGLLRVAPERVVVAVVPAAFAGLFLVWVLGPVVSVGSEGTLEVDRLALFPLAGRQLIPGLLLASMVGAGGVATALVLIGAVAGTAPLSPAAVLTVVAAALELAVCVAASRLVGAALSGAAQKRRWRDVALFLGPLIGLFINLAVQVWLRSSVGPDATGRIGTHHSTIGSVFRVAVLFLPSGPPAEVMVAARTGNWALAASELLVAVAYLGVLLALWWRAVQKVLTSATESAGRRAGAGRWAVRGQGRPSLFPRLVPFLPLTRAGAVAAKELRVMWREPRQRAGLLASSFPGLIPLISTRAITSHSHTVVLLAAAPMYMLAATATNQFGFDGPRHWINLAAGEDMGSDLLGKNEARAVAAGVLGVLAAVGLGARVGGWDMVVPALALGVAVFGVAMGLANVVSVYFPWPMPDSSSNLFSAGSTGQGLAAAGPAFLVLFGGAAVCGPMVVASLATAGHGGSGALVAAIEVAVGFIVWRVLWLVAVRRGDPRQPELLERLSPKHA